MRDDGAALLALAFIGVEDNPIFGTAKGRSRYRVCKEPGKASLTSPPALPRQQQPEEALMPYEAGYRRTSHRSLVAHRSSEVPTEDRSQIVPNDHIGCRYHQGGEGDGNTVQEELEEGDPAPGTLAHAGDDHVRRGAYEGEVATEVRP